MGTWVERYNNYYRARQGLGGFLVPAERFHGQTKKALSAINNGIDISGQYCYISIDVERSLINLGLSSQGRVTLYLLGQPVELTGVRYARSPDTGVGYVISPETGLFTE